VSHSPTRRYKVKVAESCRPAADIALYDPSPELSPQRILRNELDSSLRRSHP
jgi:hypothetical protein